MLTALVMLALAPPVPAAINFDRDIRPVLSDACFSCHGPDAGKRKARLRLDAKEGLFGPTRDAAEADRDLVRPASIVTPGNSALSELIHRIESDDPDEQMPPPDAARQLTQRERALLRAWVEGGATWSGHWAFEPVHEPPVPAVASPWCKTDVDRFVLERIRAAAEGMEPAPEADRSTLLRRVYLDLTGLPPTPEETRAFLEDSSSDAYERVVDRLLDSPRFGEHMAMSWLETSRYSDSNGFQLDLDRTAWPWRDWVVRAFNSNLPYDRFILEQIAGDMLPDASSDQVLATAFNRNHPINGEGGREIEESRIDYVHDRVDTTATVFLGLTMSCAQCHDHKYDPLSQRDYYSFFAYFNSVDEDGAGDRGDMPPLATWKSPAGADLQLMVMKERAEPRSTHVLVRGAWDQPGENVSAGVPAVFGTVPDAKDRLGLARWMVDRSNPLTSRVAVNRVWQMLFGRGLVRTPENFGLQGERPTHPELLDFLAARFMASGWNVKGLLKLIVTSEVYRQASVCSTGWRELDPENRLLGRAPRFRLPSAVLRDQALLASGLLVERLGGPPVKPYHPGGVWEDVSFGRLKYERGTGDDLYRRSLYTFWRRTAPPANMFDVSLRQRCSVRVIRTNTPLQSLVLLNDVTYAEAAASLARRVMLEITREEPGLSEAVDRARIRRAWQLVLAREPGEEETRILTRRLDALRAHYTAHMEEATAAACTGDSADPPENQRVEVAAFAGIATVLFNLDEAQTRE